MTATYDRGGITFMYPDNWSIMDEQLDTLPRSVSVQAPGGAFWSVDIHPFSVHGEDVLKEMVAAISEEYDDVEVQEVEDLIDEHPATGVDIDFSCLDFLVTAKLRSFQNGHATYVMLYQAEDRDYEEFEPVFRAITHSLLKPQGRAS